LTLALQITDARRLYGAKAAVDGASLTLKAGRIACLLGPSGCGKSTLLRLIAGLEPLDGGTIAGPTGMLSGPGAHLPPERRDVGFVFQDYALFPHLTVAENVAFGLRRLPAAEREARVAEQLRRVRLQARASAYPQALSGGEQQRIALARALAREPAVVLLDEPFSGLDSQLKADVRDVTLAALREAGAAALVVTHDAEEALVMADDLALMDAGRILQAGSPREVYGHPVSLAAARLLGEADALPGCAVDGRVETAFGALPAPLADGPVTVMLRPEALVPVADGVEATVVASRFAGHTTLVRLARGGVEVGARWRPSEAPEAGATVRVRLDERFCAVFAG
jgi:iron(III) transport system ATP-binding protein